MPQSLRLPPLAAEDTSHPAAARIAQPGRSANGATQFPNSDVADILRLYEQLTGKKLVIDNFVQGKVNIFIAKDIPRDEAIKIIEMNLLPQWLLAHSIRRQRHC